jgi:signal transduction histidine kinase
MVSIAVTHAPSRMTPWPALKHAAAAVGVGLCVAAVGLVATTAPEDERVTRALLQGLVVGVPLATGLYACARPSTARFGLALLAAGVVWSLSALGESTGSVAYSIGRLAAWLIIPIIAYLVLAFPDGRLEPGTDRRILGGSSLIVALLVFQSAVWIEADAVQTPWPSCQADCPPNAFEVLGPEPGVVGSVVAPVGEALIVALSVVVCVKTFRRWRVAAPLGRRVLAPLLLTCIVSTGVVVAFVLVRRLTPEAAAVETLGRLWTLTVPAIAVAFLIGLVARRAMGARVLEEVSMALSRRLDRRELRSALAAALDDPTMDILVPDAMPGRWRDVDGRLTSRHEAVSRGRGHMASLVHDEGLPIAALVHDAALHDDDELLRAVRALVLTTLRHERLTTRLAASLRALDDSRTRIARAADLERSRIERDLHDGAQQRLIGLRIKLSVAEELGQVDAAAGFAAVHELGPDVDRTLEDLRALAQGVYPSLLTDRGLADALRSVLAESPLNTHIKTRDVTRQPAEVETAVYFTCLEAVQNASKHAEGATSLWVALQQDRDLRFEVRDDGLGFEPPIGGLDGGLRNMRDRTEAIGGRLTIDSSLGHGTRIRGVVPLR